jgi:hypothetical protein
MKSIWPPMAVHKSPRDLRSMAMKQALDGPMEFLWNLLNVCWRTKNFTHSSKGWNKTVQSSLIGGFMLRIIFFTGALAY